MKWKGEIIGHRGAAGLAPENTLESFEAAIEAGADRVEFDVRCTLDRRAVVFHDLNVDRFVPDARGRTVTRHSLAEMLAIDVGAALGRPGCHVPSLDALLEKLKGRVKLNLEVKGSGADGLLGTQLALEALRRAELEDDTVISSFHEPVVRGLAKDAPALARAWIVDERTEGDVVAKAADLGCQGLHPRSSLVDSGFVRRCHAARMALRAWTVDEPNEMRRMMSLGVDGIVTDFPDRLRTLAKR